MASVGNSVRAAIDEWERGEFEFAMLHACNAVDGTAAKVFPNEGSNARFTGLLREQYAIFGPMALPGIDLLATRWPVKVDRPKATGGLPDIADVIYGVHRCSHGHGRELPDGFELWPDAAGPDRHTRFSVEKGKLQLSDRVIFGLLGVAVFSPANIGQEVPEGYHLTFAGTIMLINDWWGRSADFLDLAASEPLPSVLLDFSNWQ
ncbi:hypothetical protein [Pseudomonas syringae]|uniref:hypothetical protein n=1 Tax=Pseudomonas syringae TaxID=317 RepID=UPI000BB5A7E1|nr:hypothetical protein [Pseudomonas syringae]PBP44169.1 hypothetical protein CCL13_16825 [Pseudomonas syringae]